MKVVLTEKPSVARDIAKVLNVSQKRDGYFEGKDYLITWAFGHLVQLVNPEHYDPKYKQWQLQDLPIIPDNFIKDVSGDSGIKKQFNTISQLFNNPKVTQIICATDAGREGELIFRLIYEMSECKKPISRLWISSQTDQAILDGFKHLKPGEELVPLYQSSISRARADWLIGMNATRAYTIRFSQGQGVMSVGRVQTPVLKMIVERHSEHINFKPKTYYEIVATILHANGTYEGKWFDKKEDRILDKSTAETLLERIKQVPQGQITQLNKKEITEKQPLLYDLTELQKEANKQFKFSADHTLKTMQNLYEKHKLITYPRTSSRYLSSDMVGSLKGLIQNIADLPDYSNWARDLLTQKLPITKRIVDNKKITDHHAVIPTEKKANLSQLSADEQKIFDLILKRFLCVFMDACKKAHTEIISTFSDHTFKTTGTIITEPGWRRVYLKDAAAEGPILPNVKKEDPVTQQETNLLEKETKAPPLHNEASILAAMETAGKSIEDEELKEAMKDCGLGTPATRAQILERLIQVKYINREKNRLIPTEKGYQLINCIQDPALLSAELTGEWEKKLNDMARNQYSEDTYMNEIKDFTKQIIQNVADSKEGFTTEPIGTCPICKGNITETAKGYSCANWKETNCNFVIWKTMASKTISIEIAKQLLEKGETGPLEGFKNKSEKLFSAPLKLDKDKKVVFNFQDYTPENAIGKCPLCKKGDIHETAKAFGCSLWKEKNCPFVIWKNIAGKPITKDIASAIVEKGQTETLSGFVSRAGKSFEAKLVLKNKRVEMEFNQR